MHNNSVSVRHDEEKYIRYSMALEDAIAKIFDGQLRVEVLNVATWYALEIRVMPDDFHPRNGRCYHSKEAEAVGMTVFSKINSKKWPNLENVIHSIQEHCPVPVRFALLGRELKVESPGGEGGMDGDEEGTSNRDVHSPLRRVEFVCTHTHGQNFSLYTNAKGIAEATLFPGKFSLHFTDESAYDDLTPTEVMITPEFKTMEFTITASMKKKCTFYVIDHLNRPYPSFPFKLEPKEGVQQGAVSIRTRHDGKCRQRLGRGVYVASPIVEDGAEPSVAPMRQELEVLATDQPQFFRLVVQRVKFKCEIILHTRFEEPVVRCPFQIRRDGMLKASGTTSDIGVAMAELSAGQYKMSLKPLDHMPYVETEIDIFVTDNGAFDPATAHVATKITDVHVHLVTPDGEAAPDCGFSIEPQFPEPGGSSVLKESSLYTDESGVAICRMGLLEPYIFRIRESDKAQEYMPQYFVFQTDRDAMTAVVARSVFGTIVEEKVALVIDASGSLAVYLDDIKAALNSVIFQQFNKSNKSFNLVSYSDKVFSFRPDLVDCEAENITNALRFCEGIQAGGNTSVLQAVETAFQSVNVEAVYLLSDGKNDINDMFLNRIKVMYYSHPNRPKLNTIGINCVPRKNAWKNLQAVATLTNGVFRPICLEQNSNAGKATHDEPGLSMSLDMNLLDVTQSGFDAGLDSDN